MGGLWAPHRHLHELNRRRLTVANLVADVELPLQLAVHADFLARMRSLFVADARLFRDFRHVSNARLSCPITVYGGTSDSIVSEDLVLWGQHTTASFEVVMVEGGHMFILEDRTQYIDNMTARLAQVKCFSRAASCG